jgi:nitrate reductase NapE component
MSDVKAGKAFPRETRFFGRRGWAQFSSLALRWYGILSIAVFVAIFGNILWTLTAHVYEAGFGRSTCPYRKPKVADGTVRIGR